MIDKNCEQTFSSCRDCLWAVYDGKTQTGCQLGLIDKFQEHWPGLVTECYDEEKEFFVLRGRTCQGHRLVGGKWDEAHPENKLSAIQEELTLKLGVIVLVKGLDEGLSLTAKSLTKQSPLPHQTFFSYCCDLEPARVHEALWDVLGTSLTWRVARVFREGASNGYCLDEAVKKFDKQVTHYAVFHQGFVVPEAFTAKLQVMLYERMERFSLIKPDAQGNGQVVNVRVHRHPAVNGHWPVEYGLDDEEKITLSELEDKLKYLAKREAKESYLLESILG